MEPDEYMYTHSITVTDERESAVPNLGRPILISEAAVPEIEELTSISRT
jgi:hypothetical protein